MEEDDKMLQKVPLVSIGAENKVSVQGGAKIQERVKHASKEGTNFSMDQCWFHNGIIYGEKTWLGIDTSTWLIRQKIAIRTVGKVNLNFSFL